MTTPLSKIAMALVGLADEIDQGPMPAPVPVVEAPRAFDKTAALHTLRELGGNAEDVDASLLDNPAVLTVLEKVSRTRVAPEPLGEPSDYTGSNPPAPRNGAEAVKLAWDSFADGIMHDRD